MAPGKSFLRDTGTSGPTGRTFRFADCVLDTHANVLRRDGRAVALQPKALELLGYLVTHRDRAVPRDEILAAVWPGESVTVSSITSCLHKIRKALGPETGALVQTVRGHGLRFAGDCESLDPETTSEADPDLHLTELPRIGSVVGRETEWSTLQRLLNDARSGIGRAVLVRGVEGVGKSALVDELCSAARGSGVRIVEVSCHEGRNLPSLWPWRRIAASLLASPDQACPVALPQPLRASLSHFAAMSDAALTRPDAVASDRLSGSTVDGRSLLDAVCRVMEHAADPTGLVVVLEDVQWADADAIALWRSAAGRLRDSHVLLVATMRSNIPNESSELVQQLRSLDAAEAIERIDVGPLPPDETASMVARVVAGEVSAELASRVFSLSAGIPVFVEQAALHLVSQPAAQPPDLDAVDIAGAVPEASRAVIVRQLAHLDSETREVLRLASLLGRSFTVEALVEAVEADRKVAAKTAREIVSRAVEQAIAGGAFHRVPGDSAALRFAHGLLHGVVAAELPPGRKARLHWRIGVSAAKRRASEGGRASVAARHLIQGVGAGEPGPAIDACLAAAEEASSSREHAEAAALLRQADVVAAHAAGIDLQRHAEILVALVEALGEAGLSAHTHDVAFRAADVARACGRGDLLARALVAGGRHANLAPRRRDAQRMDRLREALALRPALPAALRVRLLVQLALESFYGDRNERVELAGHAVKLARELDRPEVLFDALRCRVHVAVAPGELDASAVIVREMSAVGDQSGDPERKSLALAHEAVVFGQQGDFENADSAMAESERLGDLAGLPTSRVRVATWRSMLSVLRGDWREAEAQRRVALEAARPVDADLEALIERSRMLSVLVRGDLVAGVAAEEADRDADRAEYGVLLIHALLAADKIERARVTLASYFPKGIADLPRDDRWLPMAIWLGIAATRLGDRSLSEVLYRELLPHADRHALFTHWGIVGYLGSVRWVLGELATNQARWPEAEQHLESAVATSRELGARPFLAQARLAEVRLLSAWRRGARDARVEAALAEARALAEELDMPDLRRRIQELRW